MGIAAIGIASLAATAVGAVMQYKANKAQAAAIAQQEQYQAQVAKNNQQIAEWNAQYAEQKGNAQAQASQIQTAQMMGTQRARFAASNLDSSTGSPLRIQSDTAKLGEYDVATIRSNAAREAYGWRSQGLDYAAQAGLNEMAAASAIKAGEFGASASLVGGAASVGNKWVGYKQSGVFS